jgi:putative MATE family efflux protein
MKRDGITLMESTPVPISILQLALPMMLASIAQMIYNITDTFFIGQTGDPNMVAGISLAMPLFMFSQGIGNVFAIGAASYISRMLGAKNMDEARYTNAVSFYVTLATGVIITVLLMFLQKPILHIIGTSDVTFPYASDYFFIIAVFMSFAMVNIALNGQIRAEGASAVAMVSMLIGIIINIILDPLFILYFGWGVKGAAWATVIGIVSSVCYAVLYYVKGNSHLSIHIRHFVPNRKMLSEILKIGVPAGIANFAFTLAVVVSNIIAASYGDYVVAGSGISVRITMLCFSLIMSLAMGYMPFAGFNYGAKNIKRLSSGLKITVLYTTTLAIFFTVIFFFFGKDMMVVFIRDAQTIDAGSKMMRAFLVGMPLLGIQMTIMVTFQALGKPIHATVVNLGRQFLIYLPLLFLLNSFFGFTGFIYAQPISDIITTIVAVSLSVSLFKNFSKQRLFEESENPVPAAGTKEKVS